jgi:L-lysine exporter family protein LysE/ArgO
MWQILLLGMGVGLGAAAAPGPINIEIVRRALAYGPRLGAAFGLGAVSADLIYVTATSMGASALVQTLPDAGKAAMLTVVALLLMILGVKALLTKMEDEVALVDKELQPPRETPRYKDRSLSGSYFLGLALTLSNPTTIGYWSVISIAATEHRAGRAIPITLPLVCGVATACTLWVIAVVTIAGRFHRVMNPRMHIMVERAAGLILCLFAVLSAAKAVQLFL